MLIRHLLNETSTFRSWSHKGRKISYLINSYSVSLLNLSLQCNDLTRFIFMGWTSVNLPFADKLE